MRELSPVHLSCQKKKYKNHPPPQKTCLEKLSHLSLILRHNPQPWALLQTLVLHSPFPSPYFMPMTLLHRWEVSWPYLQSHFPNRAWLNDTKLRIPNPPNSRGKQTFSQATKEYLKHSVEEPQEISAFSNYSSNCPRYS